MNLKLQLRELAARSQRMVELARGDFAIPALKKILKHVPRDEFNKAVPIFKGKFPSASMKRGLVDKETGEVFFPTRSDLLSAMPIIRKDAAQAIREARRR
jgi:hypothetical protein